MVIPYQSLNKLLINVSPVLNLDLLVSYMRTQMILATGSFFLARTGVLKFNNNRACFLLSKFCISKAEGLDMISARLLRECADLISCSL